MLLSGGVDSTVCAALMRQALNEDQIIAIHIDNGFMRKRESENVRDSLAKIGIQVKGRTIYSSLSRWIALIHFHAISPISTNIFIDIRIRHFFLLTTITFHIFMALSTLYQNYFYQITALIQPKEVLP